MPALEHVLRAPARKTPDEDFATYVAAAEDLNWSDDLEALHEDSSRDHFLDVQTRGSILDQVLDVVPPSGVVLDAGCSTGYLLEDLRRVLPEATLIGVDLVANGLRKAKATVPDAHLALADVLDLPVEDQSVDAVVSANLLEHVPDDVGALKEFHRVLRPGGRVAVVVPAGPSTYDYYDKFLTHERRYARHEMARKGEQAGLDVRFDTHLGTFIYPAFWFVKRRNRRKHPNPGPEEMTQLVSNNIDKTSGSRTGSALSKIESGLTRRRVPMPLGIRSFVVFERR